MSKVKSLKELIDSGFTDLGKLGETDYWKSLKTEVPKPLSMKDLEELAAKYRQEYPKDMFENLTVPGSRVSKPTAERAKMTKTEFWERVIKCGPDGEHRRLVAYRDIAKAEMIVKETKKHEVADPYRFIVEREHETNTRLFIPNSPEDEFNLVLSLCSDGLHRPVYDLDFTRDQMKFTITSTKAHAALDHNGGRSVFDFPSNDIIIVDSTNHCHVYCKTAMTWTQYQESLALVPGEDARKYAHNTNARGYGALRAPWIKKEKTDSPDE